MQATEAYIRAGVCMDLRQLVQNDYHFEIL